MFYEFTFNLHVHKCFSHIWWILCHIDVTSSTISASRSDMFATPPCHVVIDGIFHMYQVPKGKEPNRSSRAPSWWSSHGVQTPRSPTIPFLYVLNRVWKDGVYKPLKIHLCNRCGIKNIMKLNLHHWFHDRTVAESPPSKNSVSGFS